MQGTAATWDVKTNSFTSVSAYFTRIYMKSVLTVSFIIHMI